MRITTFYGVLLVVTIGLHLGWVAWVLFGWLFCPRCRRLVQWFYLGSVAHAILAEVFSWPCALTIGEVWLRPRAGFASYPESFLEHYLHVMASGSAVGSALTVLAVIFSVLLVAVGLPRSFPAWRAEAASFRPEGVKPSGQSRR